MPFLAAATHWVELQQQIIFRQGRALTAEEQQLAARVGVACPARVYVYEVASIKRPDARAHEMDSML